MPCVAVQNKTWFIPWRDIFDCHKSASCITRYTGCVISIVARAWCGNQCESDVRIASCLSVSRLVEKGFAVVMGNEQGNTLSKDGRVIHLHKSNGVYHVRAIALSELCPLEDQDPRNDEAPPAEAVGEANVPWTRRLPHKPTEDERLALG